MVEQMNLGLSDAVEMSVLEVVITFWTPFPLQHQLRNHLPHDAEDCSGADADVGVADIVEAARAEDVDIFRTPEQEAEGMSPLKISRRAARGLRQDSWVCLNKEEVPPPVARPDIKTMLQIPETLPLLFAAPLSEQKGLKNLLW